ncbi:MAG: aldo/keto reductase [Desulfobacula sp.]|uniref:aldo/keto reductase n=1 Tax=Desulfobacula sp. TaxID=2593537 RepID=UPI0025C016A0|nr:aldo/keto reductase [Desulfobacula sp.]MCD4719804.1 aldo/keto reductase [Desulfobacula sp.]
MQYRKIPKTGEEISILGFGCMRLPEKRGGIDEKRAKKQLLMAIDEGVNYFDTAMPYHMGASETFLGKALSEEGLRGKINIATKLPPWSVNQSEDMDKLISAQLKKLKTDYIDYYLLHALNGEFFKKLLEFGVLEFLSKLKADGIIRNAGFSFHGKRKDFKKIIDSYDWEFCQIQYNYLDIKSQAGKKGLEYASEKDVGIIIMEPLRGGNLAKNPPKQIKEIWEGSETKRKPVEWSLEWIWNHPQVTTVLSGMNNEDHITQNIKIANKVLPESMSQRDLEIVSKTEKLYRKFMKVGCTGCGYCMPCPSGVNIPTCFEFYNDYHMFDDKKNAKLFYLGMCGGLLSNKPSYASLCEECGECEKVCPQGLPIIDSLKDVTNEFEGFQFRMMLKIAKAIFGFKRWNILRKNG